jgi:LPXTG-motif cell wall-anchored protein
MKKFAMVLLVVGVMVLGFGLMTAFAQGTTSTSSAANTNVTVTVTDNNVTMSPKTLPVSVPVTFTFTNNGTQPHAFVIEKSGATNQPLTSGSKTASFDAIAAGGNFSTTWTFDQAGDYQLAAYKNGTLESGLVVTFTVGSAQGTAAQTGTTETPTTTASTAATATMTATATTATSAVTSTTATTGTTTTPSKLPRTGGETTNYAAMLLAFGVAAVVLGGALTFARRSR